ncbi:MAG: hypothetical protein KDE15_11225 [Erythrobacter sp.]|nr:hypothetical protein [Erythrobacter sp.]
MSEQLDREELRRRVRARAGRPQVPGPSDNAATNLLLADVAMATGTYLLRLAVERAFLTSRYGAETARQIVDNRTLLRTLGAAAVARMATRSVPGAALVSTGLVGKLVYDRLRGRRAAQQAGDAALLEQAAAESEAAALDQQAPPAQ